MNGRLLLDGRRPWDEWRTSELLDVCDVIRQEEYRFIVSLKAGVKIPQLPDVDTHRIGLRTPAGLGVLRFDPLLPVDDGTWGEEDDAWSPPDAGDEG